MTIYRDDLERVYSLIEKPERWTQGTSARDAEGDCVGIRSQSAKAWCVIGAFEKCELSVGWEMPTRLLLGDEIADELARTCRPGGLAEFNDSHTHAEVLALLKAAIERAPVRP